MNAIHKLNCKKGLDLILHTEGGDLGATESIINYLHQKFDHIRVIVPQIAMSAGTMMALSSDEIVMGKQSALGPTDPQIGNISAHGILEEFKKAYEEIKKEPQKQFVWLPILQKYHPTFLGQCESVIKWGKTILRDNLKKRMFKNSSESKTIEELVNFFSDYGKNFAHNRPVFIENCQKQKLNIKALENDDKLQDLVLTIHHSLMHLFDRPGVYKIIENHLGNASICIMNTNIPR